MDYDIKLHEYKIPTHQCSESVEVSFVSMFISWNHVDDLLDCEDGTVETV